MTTPPRKPESFLPLSQSIFRILLALGEEELHGYAVMQAITEKSGGRERLLPGTLYANVAKMVDSGLVEELDPPEGAASGGPRRRYYRRTKLGRAVAKAESERMEVLLDIARSEKLLVDPA